jgi:DNA (cytosine-5)-methyltransferase 1
MRFGSVCSGIEAASVAWHPLGWKAAWLSEIEPFPCAVLAHHYPDVPNLGDMTTLPERILSGEVEAPDLFCGGTPCQAFSVAGLRNSLDDARGNLSLTFVGIANAIDHVRSVRRDAPGIIFWENVPGVLSTKDNAFGCFLAALAGEDDPIIPSGEKWTNAGCVYGPQRTVAWRVLDAQYFGVAQRRRRVFVVASARDDFDPAAVLFEFDGLRRDTAPSREKGQAIAPCVTNGPPFRRTGNERVEAEAMVAVYRCKCGYQFEESLGAYGCPNCEGDSGPAVTTHRMVAFGEYTDDGTASAMKARDYKDATDLVAQPIPIDMRNAGRDPEKHDAMNRQGVGIGEPGDPAHTVTSAFVHGVAHAIALQDITPREKAQNGKGWNDDGTAYTVDTHATQGVAQPIAFHPTQDPISSTDGTTHCMGTGSSQGKATVAVAHQYIGGVDYENNAHTMDQPTGPLLKGSPTGGGRPLPAIATTMQVRRLTPVECERLQGFPDGYTNIPWRKKPESPDGPRYKALGNSWAVPNVRWIGKRIQEALNG